MFEAPKGSSSQLKTVLRYLELIGALDLVELDTLFADDFVQSTRPLSLGLPSRTKEEDLAFLGALAEKLKGRRVEVTVYDVIESPGKAWAHVLLHGEFQDGKAFDVESIYQFTLVEHASSNLPKIKAVVDFVDSAAFAGIGGGE